MNVLDMATKYLVTGVRLLRSTACCLRLQVKLLLRYLRATSLALVFGDTDAPRSTMPMTEPEEAATVEDIRHKMVSAGLLKL